MVSRPTEAVSTGTFSTVNFRMPVAILNWYSWLASASPKSGRLERGFSGSTVTLSGMTQTFFTASKSSA